jgi:hypothetical protein
MGLAMVALVIRVLVLLVGVKVLALEDRRPSLGKEKTQTILRRQWIYWQTLWVALECLPEER